MNILFDGEGTIRLRYGGIGNYIQNLLISLLKNDKKNHYYIIVWEELMKWKDQYDNFSIILIDCPASSNEYSNEVNKAINNYSIDVYYDPSPLDTDYVVEINKDIINVATVHDFMPYIFKENYLSDDRLYASYMARIERLKGFDILFSNSLCTKMDGERLFGFNNITNIYMSADNEEEVCEGEEWEEFKNKKGIPDKYYLYVSGIGFNKNIKNLFDAYVLADKKNVQPSLVFVGKLPDYFRMNVVFLKKTHYIPQKIIFTDYVSDSIRNSLYENAFWQICVSKYEGFGMPLLEAWKHGVPVMSSNNSSLGELADGEVTVSVNPYDIASIAEGFVRINSMDKMERERFVKAGKKKSEDFSWKKTAQLWLKQVEERYGGYC